MKRLSITLSLAIAVAAAALASALPAGAQMNAPTPMTVAQFQGAAIGAPVRLVVRVASVARDKIDACLLEQHAQDRYAPSNVTLDLYAPSNTPVIMGSANDLKPGAVLFVDAVVTGRNAADVKKIVVITPYVTVVR